MLTRPHPPPDETPTLPPIAALTTPYASAPPPHLLLGLKSLCCCGALNALLTCLQCPPHTGLILTLLQPPQNETTMLPPISALTTPYASAPRLFFYAAYNYYAPMAPSRYASDTTLNPPYIAYHPYAQILDP
ncbi:hypothetical protein O181_030610 [Austropuccinia psidii MF-1]|uniref:Uncharacterized protein n=1 Tax=Austropuccinia psidii MF-1 TaxID=1389203 RepID=A0A9Q3CXI8_9BASI|nr:hypothetical protein [Austropuccinia psidii MF-1]